jgi:uncharacterized protein DUF3592
VDFSSLTNNLGGMITALVAIPFLIIAIVFVVAALRGRAKVGAAKDWPSVSGKVTYATVETRHSHRSGGGTSTSYYPNVVYEYTVNGQRYQSSKISFGSEVGLSNYNAVLRKAAGYPINSMVQVHYNPDNPSEAVLEKASPPSGIFLLVGVLIVVILACVVTFTLGGMSFVSNFVNSVVPKFPK